VAEFPPVRDCRRERKKEEIPPGYKGVGESISTEGNLSVTGEGCFTHLPQNREVKHVVLAQPLSPLARLFSDLFAQGEPAIEFYPMALSVLEPDSLNAVEILKSPSKAGCGILTAGKQN
jgi:hypothetical protein